MSSSCHLAGIILYGKDSFPHPTVSHLFQLLSCNICISSRSSISFSYYKRIHSVNRLHVHRFPYWTSFCIIFASVSNISVGQLFPGSLRSSALLFPTNLFTHCFWMNHHARTTRSSAHCSLHHMGSC